LSNACRARSRLSGLGRLRGALFAGLLTVLLALIPRAASAQADAGVHEHTRIERPPQGSLRRGAWVVPPWAAYAIGGAIAMGAAAALIARLRRRR
jgi:hypothetical protein